MPKMALGSGNSGSDVRVWTVRVPENRNETLGWVVKFPAAWGGANEIEGGLADRGEPFESAYQKWFVSAFLEVTCGYRLLVCFEHGIRRGLHSCVGQTLEVVLSHRLHLGRRRSHATELRADAKHRWRPGRDVNSLTSRRWSSTKPLSRADSKLQSTSPATCMTSTSYVAQRFMWRLPRDAHKDGSITADSAT